MTAISLRAPKFRRKQLVRFTGGEGTVRSYKFEFGGWTYLVEMELEEEPEFGRVGAETMVLFSEADLCAG